MSGSQVDTAPAATGGGKGDEIAVGAEGGLLVAARAEADLTLFHTFQQRGLGKHLLKRALGIVGQEGVGEVRARISEAVGAIDKAFLKQVEALDAYRFIDLESEMDVLADMLRQDGLTEEAVSGAAQAEAAPESGDDPFAGLFAQEGK